MKKVIIVALLLSFMAILGSCARGITPYEAAHGKAKCGRSIR